MDKEQCKFLLRAFRPGAGDVHDPAFRDALAQAARDPELKAWFEREQSIDRRIAASLRTVPAPEGLRGQILSGIQLSADRRPSRLWATISACVVAAACVTFAIVSLWPTAVRATPFDAIVESASIEATRPVTLSYFSESANDLAGWLEREAAPIPVTLPGSLRGMTTIGCRVYSWNGVGASLICFRSIAESGGVATTTILHLYVVHQSSCSGGISQETPMVFARDSHSIATWRDEKRFYVLVASMPENTLRNLVLARTAHAPLSTATARARMPVSM